ncbi:MAG: chloride channel protein [Alphaproteobacteria bacterium]|nr:chloride channel protein [Alphaproteobacteria bacterium]MDE2495539.1 chloride channel protein [Alphaproteobacteria bacterium]
MERTFPTERPIGLLALSFVAVGVGVITGFGAIFFRGLIGLIHNLFYFGHFTYLYDANIYAPPSPLGVAIILVPVVGGMGVVFLVSNFAPEARGHGVPEVMDAIFYQDGKIRPVVAIVKSIASALAIGTGAAVGREGPIIQIGASLGSTVGQIVRMEAWQRITLVAAGAGAGIAATFNTPIGGVMFAIELMMPEVSVRTFLPVALATGTATFVARLFLGLRPAFEVPSKLFLSNQPASLDAILLYVLLGGIVGVAATGFIRGLHETDKFFERVRNPYLRHAAGMTIVGVMMYAFLLGSGHYHVDGVGYSTVQDILLGGMAAAPFMIVLFVSKLAATVLSLGSGSSGGIFSPSLFMGATLGGAFGAVAHMLFPLPDITIAAFAMVGMAAMVGGATGAAMTAVTMIFEMTRDYDIVMPMIVAVAVSIGVRRLLSSENIYTIKLVARRHFIPKALHANMFLIRPAGDVMDKSFLVLPHDMEFDAFLKRSDLNGTFCHIIVINGDSIVGTMRVNVSLRRGLEGAYTGVTLGDVASRKFTIAREEDVMFGVIDRMWRKGASMIIVVRTKRIPHVSDITGVITKEHVADSVADSVRPYAEHTGTMM